MSESRLQQSSWLNEDKCKYLQNRWGEYDTFRTNPNKANKIPFMDEMDVLTNYLSGQAEVLEVGCGSGHFLWVIKDNVKKLIGLDYSDTMLGLTKEQFKNESVELELINGSCWELPFPDNHVDISFQIDVCMHVGGSWDAIREMIRVSRKYVLFTGPSFENFRNEMDRRIDKKSFAISMPLLIQELEIMKSTDEIIDYTFLRRPRTKMYNHEILEVKI